LLLCYLAGFLLPGFLIGDSTLYEKWFCFMRYTQTWNEKNCAFCEILAFPLP